MLLKGTSAVRRRTQPFRVPGFASCLEHSMRAVRPFHLSHVKAAPTARAERGFKPRDSTMPHSLAQRPGAAANPPTWLVHRLAVTGAGLPDLGDG